MTVCEMRGERWQHALTAWHYVGNFWRRPGYSETHLEAQMSTNSRDEIAKETKIS